MPARRLAALLAIAAAAAGAAVDGHAVEGKIKLPLKLLQEGDLRTTEVTLNGGEHRAFTRPDGSFRFTDVAPGVYLLDVLSTEYLFSQFKLNLPEDDGEIRVLEYMYPGANKRAAAYPVDLRPHVKLEYFDKRQQPGLHTLFRNPMLLMMGFTMLMVFTEGTGGGASGKRSKTSQSSISPRSRTRVCACMHTAVERAVLEGTSLWKAN